MIVFIGSVRMFRRGYFCSGPIGSSPILVLISKSGSPTLFRGIYWAAKHIQFTRRSIRYITIFLQDAQSRNSSDSFLVSRSKRIHRCSSSKIGVPFLMLCSDTRPMGCFADVVCYDLNATPERGAMRTYVKGDVRPFIVNMRTFRDSALCVNISRFGFLKRRISQTLSSYIDAMGSFSDVVVIA